MKACGCKGPTCLLPILAGIVVGLLYVFFGTITNLIPFLWIAFGLSVGVLLVLIGASLVPDFIREEDSDKCTCKNGACVLLGATGTLVTSIIAIVVGALSTVLGFLLVGFLAWLLVALFLYILCLVNSNCN